MGNQLTSAGALAYQGTNAASPSNVTVHYNAPTSNYYQGFSIGDFWVHRVSPTSNQNELWVLMGVAGNVANWVLLSNSSGALLTLTGNSGGAVAPLAGNINVVGDGTTITITGNPATHTLTASLVGTGVVESLTTDDGHVVTPTAGTIIVHGGTGITTTGTVGPNTVTIATTGAVAESFPTDSGTATPSGNVLNIKAGVSTQNCGSSVEFTGSGNTVTLNVSDASGNTVIGKSSGSATLSGTNNTILGKGSGASITTGSNNLILGEAAGTSLTGAESNNTLLNHAGVTGGSNFVIMAIPGSYRYLTTDGVDKFFIGLNSGNTTSTGSNNFVCGSGTLPNVTTANSNTIFGNNIMTTATTTGNGNLCVGGAPFHIGTGNNNLIIGNDALAAATTAASNTVIGNSAGYNSGGGGTGLTTGSNNILIGSTCGNAYTSSESSNIVIGDTPGTAGESNVLRIGFQGAAGASSITKSFIDGIRGITTVNADAVAVLIDSAGQLGTVSSSIRYKENVQDMGDSSSPLMKLRPVTFNYKANGNKDYGLIAEEVHEIMPDLVVYNDDGQPETVRYHILCSILLNELQKLEKRVKELEAKHV